MAKIKISDLHPEELQDQELSGMDLNEREMKEVIGGFDDCGGCQIGNDYY